MRLPEGFDPQRFPPALMEAIGLEEVLALRPEGAARLRFDGRPGFTHSGGTTVQGGILTAWLDCAMAWAVSARDPAAAVASLDIQVRFIARVGPGPCIAEASVLQWGRSVAVLQADLLAPGGRLLARASSTAMRL
jgi:uncharacterized protein (TIGR00369 family)